MKTELTRWFDRLAELKWEEFPTLGDWTPGMDILETKDGPVAKVEVPGMDQKDIQTAPAGALDRGCPGARSWLAAEGRG